MKVEEHFVDKCINPHGPLDYLLAYNGPQFVAKFFEAKTSILRRDGER